MAKDNYVSREQYNGLVAVDGQLIPQRGEVKPEDLVSTSPDSEDARNNGGGVDRPRRRRRRTDEE